MPYCLFKFVSGGNWYFCLFGLNGKNGGIGNLNGGGGYLGGSGIIISIKC